MKSGTLIAMGWAVGVTAVLAVLIVLGSRNLTHFDAALVAYTFATLFAAGGITYRYALWLQRPPTALYWSRGWQVFLRPRNIVPKAVAWVKRFVGEFTLNNFIFFRHPSRWAAHWLLMWGCLIAIAITFPLVFGWLSFASTVQDLNYYHIQFFGFTLATVPSDSLPVFMAFHGLDIAAFLVIAGVMLAMRRRMRDAGAAAVQMFAEDFLPLILLFSISLSGLLLTVSYTWLGGAGYSFLKLFHAITVILTLVWLPFGKFFHIFQRPAQLGVEFYQDAGVAEKPARCRRCGHAFAPELHVNDLIATERALGYDYQAPDPRVEHYQWICPRCRRAMLALAQAGLSRPVSAPAAPLPAAMPQYANPSLGQGPLSKVDSENYHP